MKQRLVEVSWKWLGQSMTIEHVAIHDCFVARYNHDYLNPKELVLDGEYWKCQGIDFTNVPKVAMWIKKFIESSLVLCFVLYILSKGFIF